MTRQQAITLQQVNCKIAEAQRRCMKELQVASEATSNAAFSTHLYNSTKAANDAQTWTQVRNHLEERKGQ